MKFKANHDLVLPDGGFVKAGTVFGYDGDATSFLSVVEEVSDPEQAKAKTAKAGKKQDKPEQAKAKAEG